MGDPSRQKRKYEAPFKLWEGPRIEEERGIMKEYGLKNKREIWKMRSLLRKFSREAKELIASSSARAEEEKKNLLLKLQSLALIPPTATMDDVLGLSLKDILERRLQTILLRKNFAKTVNQSRQFITHEHVMIGDKKITSPSYLVSVKEEPMIKFYPSSSLSDPEHVERQVEKPEEKVEKKEKKKPGKAKEEKKEKQKKEKKPEEKKEEKKEEPEEK